MTQFTISLVTARSFDIILAPGTHGATTPNGRNPGQTDLQSGITFARSVQAFGTRNCLLVIGHTGLFLDYFRSSQTSIKCYNKQM